MEDISLLYKTMLLIREVEQHIIDVYHTDVIKSPVHLSIGQEFVAAGACLPLKQNDMMANTYRCHATYLAKGGDLNKMIAELYGKKGGCANGKAGSMHLIDMDNGVLGASAVVGTTIPVSAGFALALKRENKKRLILTMFGDGATEEGCFLETINFAALHQLPMIFLCENNHLAIHTPIEKRWATPKLCERIATYDIPTHKLTDGDVFTLKHCVEEAAARIRHENHGPVFIECDTYRWLEHVGPGDDHEDDYRDKAVLATWKANDQIEKLGSQLATDTRRAIQDAVRTQLDNAIAFATNCPLPTQKDLHTHVYA